MKRIFCVILSIVSASLMTVTSFAAPRETPRFDLYDIIENYEPHSWEEVSKYRGILTNNGTLFDAVYPDVSSRIIIVSGSETWHYSRKTRDIYGDETAIMRIKKDNGFVDLGISEMTDEGQIFRPRFSDDALEYLDSLSYTARVNFMLNFYLSVIETEEAVGIKYEKLLRGVSGDVNGDGKINVRDSYALINFVMENGSAVIPQNCDLDGNGIINSRDNFCLKKIIISG